MQEILFIFMQPLNRIVDCRAEIKQGDEVVFECNVSQSADFLQIGLKLREILRGPGVPLKSHKLPLTVSIDVQNISNVLPEIRTVNNVFCNVRCCAIPHIHPEQQDLAPCFIKPKARALRALTRMERMRPGVFCGSRTNRKNRH